VVSDERNGNRLTARSAQDCRAPGASCEWLRRRPP
jgi:hypothetical protein